jgi:O-antigen/teichoic acid export membrane protein
MVRQGALVFGSSMTLSVGGFLYHAIASRTLGVEEYGKLYALISAVAVVVLPVSLVLPVITRFAAEFRALRDDSHVRGLARDVTRVSAALGLLYVLCTIVLAPPISAYLRVPVWSVPFVGLMAEFTIFSSAFRALAQGTQDFVAFAFSVAGEGMTKVAAMAIFAVLGLRLIGGVLGFSIGLAVGMLVVGLQLLRRYRGTAIRVVQYDWRRIALSGAGSAALTIATTLIGSVDVVLVKHYFSATDAGLYSAAALGGKILLYFVGFVPTVLLPQATDRHVRGQRTRDALIASIGTLVILALGGLAVMKFFGPVILHALVGHAYDAATSLLVGYATAMVLLATIALLGSYGLATHRLAFAVPLLAGTLLTIGAIAAFHPSLAAVVDVLAAGNALTCAAVAIAITWQGLRSLTPTAATE